MRDFIPIPKWIVLYECNQCWGYFPEQSFIRDPRSQFWLSLTCKSCLEKDGWSTRPLTYEEALELKKGKTRRWILSDLEE